MIRRQKLQRYKFFYTAIMIIGGSCSLGACLGKLPSENCVDGVCTENGSVGSMDLPCGIIDLPFNFITITPGTTLDLRSKVKCPSPSAPCRYRWDLDGKQVSSNKDLGQYTFNHTGFFNFLFTVSDAQGVADPNPSSAHIAVWNGLFEDDFNRTDLQWDSHGWRRPLISAETPYYELLSGWLHVTGDYNRPGSTAITAWPTAQNARVEVTVKRVIATTYHWIDIILRMHPSAGIGHFYRVRLAQTYTPSEDGTAPHHGIEIAIFKISQSNDEHGVLLNDPTQPVTDLPTQCQECPTLLDYPRDKDIRMIAEINENQFHVQIFQPDQMAQPVLEATATDEFGEPYLYDGFVGLAHYEGLSDFDDFVFSMLN